jgi:hypothetical protein
MKFKLPQTFETAYIILFVILATVLIIDARLREDYNKGVEYSDKAIGLISSNICPLCQKNRTSKYRIKVGYVFDRSFIPFKLLRIGSGRKSDEITGSVPICENCKDEFLAFRISDPSKMVLVRKTGCHRGLHNPYEKGNIFTED